MLLFAAFSTAVALILLGECRALSTCPNVHWREQNKTVSFQRFSGKCLIWPNLLGDDHGSLLRSLKYEEAFERCRQLHSVLPEINNNDRETWVALPQQSTFWVHDLKADLSGRCWAMNTTNQIVDTLGCSVCTQKDTVFDTVCQFHHPNPDEIRPKSRCQFSNCLTNPEKNLVKIYPKKPKKNTTSEKTYNFERANHKCRSPHELFSAAKILDLFQIKRIITDYDMDFIWLKLESFGDRMCIFGSCHDRRHWLKTEYVPFAKSSDPTYQLTVKVHWEKGRAFRCAFGSFNRSTLHVHIVPRETCATKQNNFVVCEISGCISRNQLCPALAKGGPWQFISVGHILDELLARYCIPS